VPLHIAILFSSDIHRGFGTSERIYQIAKELSAQGFQLTLGAARFWEKLAESQNPTVIAMSRGRITILHMFIWLVKIGMRGLICRYDIVQIEASSTKSLALFLLIHPFGRRFIIVFHDKEFTENDSPRNLIGRLRLVAQRIAITLFDASITPGLTVKRFLEEQHGPIVNKKVFVIPNGIPDFTIRENIDSLEVRRKYGLDQDTFIALFFGTMTFEPNYEAALYLHRVSYSLSSEFEKISGRKLIFVIAGIGSEKLPKTEHFLPIGFVEELDELLTLPDVIVLPHTPSYSGPHVKTMYAFLSAKPVVASEDAVKDMSYVAPKKHFLLFDITKPNTLLEALLDLCFDRQLRRNLALNAYVDSQKFTWAYATSLHIKLYRKLLSRE
jgi:glycosyltransferase involved in cell wall biosynthesis